jgi:hypothetical protein
MKTKQQTSYATVKSESTPVINKNISLKFLLFFVVLSADIIIVKANNIAVSSVLLTGRNIASHYTLVQFNISWDNSWRVSTGSTNWDATWVFVKYRVKNQTVWNHATLNWVNGTGSGDGHTEPANSDINSSNDNAASGSYGVFIHRSADMAQGSVNYTGVKLRWNYGVDGLADGDLVEVCVFAIEMVYVPQGSFSAGSGGAESAAFYTYPTTTNSYTVSSENAITVGTTAGNLYYAKPTAWCGDQAGPIPAAFPKGYNAFYCMKYEISQDQYVAFLNELDATQFATHISVYLSNKNGISGTVGNCTTTYPYVAANWLSWTNLAAYLDWAALRPMTELEFEKACRGNQAPVANEYAWGSTSITGATGVSNDGLTNETASNAGANCAYNNAAGVQGPMRVGSFGQGVNTRAGTGASYYGIMELSGNLMERPVTVGLATGRAFTGVHGNGVLDAGGYADVINWPDNFTADGAGWRGGNFVNNNTFSLVSNRFIAAYINSGQVAAYGGRGVRLAP